MALLLTLLPWPPVASAALNSLFAAVEASSEAGSESEPEADSKTNTANFVEEIEGHENGTELSRTAVTSEWIAAETGALFPVVSAPAHRPPIAC